MRVAQWMLVIGSALLAGVLWWHLGPVEHGGVDRVGHGFNSFLAGVAGAFLAGIVLALVGSMKDPDPRA